MKKIIFFVLLILNSIIGYPQNIFNSDTRINRNTSELFSLNDELLSNQEDLKFRITDDNAINDSIEKTYFHYNLFIGTFIPTRKAKLIGVKPALGGSFGINYKKMTYDLAFEIRFGNTKSDYELANSEMTNYYLGGYFGIDVMRDMYTNKNNQILLVGGVGMDLFQIEPPEYDYIDRSFLESIFFGSEEVRTKDSVNIDSFNFNLGLMFRFYNKKKNYYAIKYRYNIVDYNSNKIRTDVTGNFHSITISFGGVSIEPI